MRRYFLVLSISLAASLAFLSLPVMAADVMIYEKGGSSIRLSDQPCEIAPLAFGLMQAAPDYEPKAATIVVNGNIIPGCWTLDKAEGKIYIGDIFGNAGFLMMSDFKRVKASGV